MKEENRRSETAALSDPRIKRRDESGGEFGGAGGEFHETVGADETGEIARGVEWIGGGEEFDARAGGNPHGEKIGEGGAETHGRGQCDGARRRERGEAAGVDERAPDAVEGLEARAGGSGGVCVCGADLGEGREDGRGDCVC